MTAGRFHCSACSKGRFTNGALSEVYVQPRRLNLLTLRVIAGSAEQSVFSFKSIAAPLHLWFLSRSSDLLEFLVLLQHPFILLLDFQHLLACRYNHTLQVGNFSVHFLSKLRVRDRCRYIGDGLYTGDSCSQSLEDFDIHHVLTTAGLKSTIAPFRRAGNLDCSVNGPLLLLEGSSIEATASVVF